jgi:glycosyltransferase involved in cell wall biosynthesis
MQIGLDITQAVKTKRRGIAQYIEQVVPALTSVPDELDYSLFIRRERWFNRSIIDHMAPELQRKWMPVSSWMSDSRLDVFHSFGNRLPAISKTPLTFTIHDFRSLDRQSRFGRQMRLRNNIKRADGIVCLTEHGKERLLHHFPEFCQDNIAVIPHGVDSSEFHPQNPQKAKQTAKRYGVHSPFLIQLGSWFPHKNLELSILAFARSRARAEGFSLVFAGGGASKQLRSSLDRIVADEGLVDSVKWIENIQSADLPLMLAASSCLLQPSRYEGFALPLLESMAVGIPGVVSDSSCLPEVSGGIWPVSGQDDAEAFAAGIDKMVFDTQSRNIAIQAGLHRAAPFTWSNTASLTSGFFQKLISNHL